MKTIWKYPLDVADYQTLELPRESKILTIQVQRGTPRLWALVDPDALGDEKVHLTIFGTGHVIPDDFAGKYVGTFQLEGGSLVFHVFQS